MPITMPNFLKRKRFWMEIMRKLFGDFCLVKFVRNFLDKRKSCKMLNEFEQELSNIEQQSISPSIPEFNTDRTMFKWNGISYIIPEEFFGMPADCDTMRLIAKNILETQECLIEDINA